MIQNNQQRTADQTKKNSTGKGIGHWARVGVMFISGGFIFPHAMTEDEDRANSSTDRTSKKTNERSITNP